jgi:hypothetical protein
MNAQGRRPIALPDSLAPLALVGLLVLPAMAGPAGANPAPETTMQPLACQSPPLVRDRLEGVCMIDASKPQRVRVAIHFTGSHDDTTAALDVFLGDATVACDSGSKTRTEGEDGDVSLACWFNTPASASPVAQVRVSARWYHAQYLGFEVLHAP